MDESPSNRQLEALIKQNHADNREALSDLKSDSRKAIDDLKTHVDQQFRLYLLREVYEAREESAAIRERAQDARMDRMEADQENDRREAVTHRRSKWLMFWTVAAAVAGGVATVVMTVLFVHGGGHA